MKAPAKDEEEDFVLTWSFAYKLKGLPAENVDVPIHDFSVALIAFHAEMQIRREANRDDYAITTITTNHSPPQHYDRYDLPPRNPDVKQCTFTKRLAKKFKAEFSRIGFAPKLA